MRYFQVALYLSSVIPAWSTLAQAWPEERPAQYKFICKEVQVPMRDGMKLMADLYLPDAPGPFPVLVERTPYNKNNCTFRKAPYFAERGYAVLIQDVRGRNRSPGEFAHLLDEGWGQKQDGYDTVEWAGTQPWSNGKVGTMGLSYTCFNQNLMAVTQPPHLKAMFCADSASNWYKDMLYSGGVYYQGATSWYFSRFAELRPVDWESWHRRRVEKRMGYWEAWQPPRMADYFTHTTYDDYWRQLAPDEHLEKFTVPTYYMSGWYDRYSHSATRMFNGIRERGGSKQARESVRLLLGPWLHGGGFPNRDRVIGAVDFGPEAAVNHAALMARWFDYHLREMDNGIMKEPPVRIFVMGINRFREENEWPLARAVETKFYLSSARSGSIDSLNDGSLSKQMAPAGDQPDVFEYDPKFPLPSIGGDLFIPPNGVQDHRPADQRSLTFTTAPFAEDTEISGPITVELYISSTADDTDFLATLSDVRPDGYAAYLRQNIQRASRRESLEKPEPIVPGKVYKLTVPIFPISNLFGKGHRLRLTISSSSLPRYLPGHNKFIGNNAEDEAPWVVARNTVYHDAPRPSVLIVPFIPPK